MTGEMKYGDVALGVESALPAVMLSPEHRQRSRFHRLWGLLVAALRRWA